MSRAAPRVSVIIPTYNRREYLAQAIDSALLQTYTNHEIVVVDDGSTDGTKEMLRERYADRELVYVSQENRGSSTARNAGIRAARGELLAFLDSDDLWMPGKLELQVPLFDRDPGVGLVFCGSAGIDDRGGVVETRVPTEEFRGDAVRAMLYRNIMPTPTVVLRRTVIPSVGFMHEDLSFGEDWNYWLRVAVRFRVDYVPDILVHFRYLAGSLSKLDFEGYRRNTLGLYRGLFVDPETSALFAPYRHEALAHAHAVVAGIAMDMGRFREARSETIRALRHRPWSREALRLLPRALVGRRFLALLRRLRKPAPDGA